MKKCGIFPLFVLINFCKILPTFAYFTTLPEVCTTLSIFGARRLTRGRRGSTLPENMAVRDRGSPATRGSRGSPSGRAPTAIDALAASLAASPFGTLGTKWRRTHRPRETPQGEGTVSAPPDTITSTKSAENGRTRHAKTAKCWGRTLFLSPKNFRPIPKSTRSCLHPHDAVVFFCGGHCTTFLDSNTPFFVRRFRLFGPFCGTRSCFFRKQERWNLPHESLNLSFRKFSAPHDDCDAGSGRVGKRK